MPKLKFNAWLTHWSDASFDSFKAHAPLMARVYPVWYTVGEGGMPQRRPEATLLRRQAVLDVAKDASCEVWPLISNFSEKKQEWDGGIMRMVMGERNVRKGHILRLLALVKEDGAQGVDLDYEALFDEDGAPFSDFVDELYAAFHAASAS